MASSWALDVTYIKGIIAAVSKQRYNPLTSMVYSKWVHNARVSHSSKLRELPLRKLVRSSDHDLYAYKLRKYTELCDEEGSYLGRCFVDEARRRAPGAGTEVLPLVRELEQGTRDQEMFDIAEETTEEPVRNLDDVWQEVL